MHIEHDRIVAQLACATRALRTLAGYGIGIEQIEIGTSDAPVLRVACSGALTRDPARVFPSGWASVGLGRDARGDWHRWTGRLYGCAVEWTEVRRG